MTQERLPVAWLRKWQEAVASECTNLTDYVAHMRSEHRSNLGVPDAEDLADSTSAYLNEPWRLLLQAPQRFAILNERDGRYSPELLTEAKELFHQAGETDSRVGEINEMLIKRVELAPQSA